MTRDQKIDVWVAVGTGALFLLGLRRVSALVGIGTGVWYLSNDRKLPGYASLGLGAAFLAVPMWPEMAVLLLSSRVLPDGKLGTPAKLGGKGNADLGGGWIMLDVSNSQTDETRAALARGLAEGTVVGLALTSHGGAPVIYLATVIGMHTGFPATYAGQWTGGRFPPGGPQMIDFNPEHVIL